MNLENFEGAIIYKGGLELEIKTPLYSSKDSSKSFAQQHFLKLTLC